ncbi:MAG TPA: hypothetical protein VM240_11605 [Verrucomicrobiae bacterium]|nr:hypothetical protein [Verrucomicrobiae bacterium]
MDAFAKHDLNGARSHWAQCLRQDTYCQWHRALDANGNLDRAAIEASKADIARAYLRDPVSMYFRTRLDKRASS